MHPHREKPHPATANLTIDGNPARRHWGVYLCLFGAWFFLASFITVFSITNDLRSARTRFFEYADDLYGEIYNRLQTNEAVLEGMASFLAAMADTTKDSAQIAHYAQQMCSRHPHIRTIELVETAARQDPAHPAARKRADGLPELRIRTFSHESSSPWRRIDDKSWHSPITPMAQMPADARNVLGLDADAASFLRLAINESARRGRAVSTGTFRSAEGDSVYTLFVPVAPLRTGAEKTSRESRLFVSLVIKAQAILPLVRPDVSGLRFSLYRADFPAHRPDGEFIHFERRGRSALEMSLFPKLIYERKLASEAQPFTLQAEQQMGWSDLDLRLLAAILAAATLSFGILFRFVVAHRRSETERCLTESRLAYLANHDALTGLANRTLLMDRLTHAMARAHRCNSRLALLFLDLDRFKQVNDTYGHGTGDQLLKTVSERICGNVREDDTVARLSGDEFIIILESIPAREGAETAAGVLKNSLAQPFPIDGEAIHIGVSIGIAIYPDDSENSEELIKIADHAMYAAKNAGRGQLDIQLDSASQNQ